MILGLVGFAGSGKGTIGDLLVENHGYKPESFAKSLKDAAAVIFGWDRDLLEGNTPQSREFRETKDEYWSKSLDKLITPRIIMQQLGTECGRDVFGTDIWVSSVERRISQDPDSDYVLTDVRFPNEIKKIQDMGGKVIRITRGLKPEWWNTASDSPVLMPSLFPEVHRSEYEWISCPYDSVFDNNVDFNRLSTRVASLVRDIHSHGPVHVHVPIY
jgi:hypothetical protein